MKKIMIIFVLLIVLLMTASYVFIPAKIRLSGSNTVATTSNGFDTCLHKQERWKQWWPKTSSDDHDSVFSYDGYTYQLITAFSDGGIIRATSDQTQFDVRIRTLAENRDSINAVWQAELETSNNPFTRINRFIKANRIKKNIQSVLNSFYSFAGQTKNIYGFSIKRSTFTEVMLIAYRFKSTALPSKKEVYDAIGKLRNYLTSQGATERYYPMMNTRKTDSFQYETMVAISIDKIIPVTADYFISRMVPMRDRFLETDIQGGPWHIQQAYDAIEKYMYDHSLSSPARPFEIMITDRSREPDTSKWVSKLFYPSM